MKLLKKIAVTLLLAALTVITTNLITGQPLTGLVKLKGLSQTFIRSSIPAWAFALVLLAALWGAYYALPRLFKNRKGKVHFSPDAHNNGWSERGTAEMDVRVSGTLTYEGKEHTIAILKVFLKGTQPATDLLARVRVSSGDSLVTVNDLWIASNPINVFLNLTLKPTLGKKGKPLRARLVLRDKYNRDFLTEPVRFPYLGG